MHRGGQALVPLAIAVLLCGDLEAQSAQAISIQVSGLYNGVFGNVFNHLHDGAGGEAQIRYTPSAFSIGAGFQYTVHGLDTLPGLDLPPEKAKLYGGFIEPRYRIHTGSYVLAPYLSARLSLLKISFSGDDLSTTANFVQLNGGGGLLYRLGSRVNLDLGATYGYNRVGSGTTTSVRNGTTSFTSSSGSNVVFRLGLAVGIGG